ncbi:Phosphoglycerate kinase 1 [Thelohanellus kitauei]|uniref:Phosphoglycerate kinase n=1 Tax=Thelohanellus kitauei TaxID=669202 RepID=A0A0C2IXQ5_THEKT|nr:Phosphoglycerate kinase 1 [Thelohanellus kitauei]
MKLGNKLGLDKLDVRSKRVLMRVDFNVPIEDGKVINNYRIVSAVKSIEYCFEKGAYSVILASHLGRPDGLPKPDYSLKPVAAELEKVMGRKVIFLTDCVGPDIEKQARECPSGSLILLENLRFHIEEEGSGINLKGEKVQADKDSVDRFRASLTKLGDVFVNDAFGTAHRAHSSMVGVDLEKRAAGFLMKKELDYFSQVLENPQRPFLALLGGSKVSDKIKLIMNILDKVNSLIIAGGMAYTFLKVHYKIKIGKSLFDVQGAELVGKIIQKAQELNVKLVFPIDFVTADEFKKDAKTGIATAEEGIPDNLMGLDIGPASVRLFTEQIDAAKLIFVNGPVGVYEWEAFQLGTKQVFEAIAQATINRGVVSVVGGGDSAAACGIFGLDSHMTHVSTGGGASMELLEGKELPGVSALSTV